MFGESGLVGNEEGGAVDCCEYAGVDKAMVVERRAKTSLPRTRRVIGHA